MLQLKDKTFAIVDIETTGGSSMYDQIIEIAILRVENGEVVKTFKTLVNPERSVSPYIAQITGINPEDLPGAPTFSDISEEMQKILEGAIFVAHNARFDYGFIRNEFKRIEINFTATCLCTVRLSRKLFPRFKKHDLTSIIQRFDLACENRHRAYDDAKVLWDFLQKIEEMGRSKELESGIQELIKKSSFPQFLDEKTVRNLPESPGVYIFYNEAGDVLYVGKSKNIKNRVMSHFSSDNRSTKEMNLCQQTKRVEARETTGELGALLLESSLVKKMIPVYNRQLRKTSLLVIARKTEVSGYFSVEIERVSEIPPDNYQNIVGVFKSITQAKEFISDICDEFGLCPKVLGIEKSKTSCFSYQLKKCTGACIGKADQTEFNKTFNRAFARRRLRTWRYDGPIIIEERDGEETHSFVLDNWCLLAEFKTGEDQEIPVFNTPVFDYDSYKIFVRFLSSPTNRQNIKLLERNDVSHFQHMQDGHIETII